MPERIDITGQKFGKLTVLGYSHTKESRAYWSCLCDCGDETVVRGDSLKGGRIKSCGCLQHRRRGEDLTGRRFGRLTVLGYSHAKKNAYWHCLCDCGNEVVVQGTALKAGYTSSCGCLHREIIAQRHKKDLTGKRFGRLTVIEDTGERRHKKVVWLCRCDCGNIAAVKGANLTNGSTRSCGCFHKEAISGSNNHNWKGGITPEREKIRKSADYSYWRLKVLKRDKYQCQACNQRGGKLHAHHLESFNNNPELRISLDNGVTLCKKCHENFHHIYGRGNNTREQFEEFKKLYGGNE